MKNYLIFLLFLFNALHTNLAAQKKSGLEPQVVIDKFIKKTGGEKWRTLKSRKEYAYVEDAEDKNSIIGTGSYERVKINTQQGKSLELHEYPDRSTMLVYKSNCNWYYSSRSQVVKFFGPEPIRFKHTFPRTELMEVLNLEPMKKVYIEDTLYRVDFKDARQLDGQHSLFFGMNSGLLYKRGYTSKNEVRWEYHFSDYKISQSFYEPRQVKLTSNGKDFLHISVKSIQYNGEIDKEVFNPPIPCKNENDYKRLEFPYLLEIE